MEIIKSKFRFRIIFVIDVVLLLVIEILQGAVLNYFFIKEFEEYFTTYFLFILDFFVLCTFIGTFVISYNYFINKHEASENEKGRVTGRRNLRLGVLPMSYVSWFIYASILIGKLSAIFIIHNSYEKKSRLLLQLLQVCLAVSSIVFMLLVEGHNWHKKSSESYSLVTGVCKKIGFEIFDSVEMLEVLIHYNRMAATTENIIFVLACSNFLLPTLSLYRLSISEFGKNVTPLCLPLRILHNLLKLVLIDIPFFIIRLRSLIFHEDLSIFMMKNLFHIIMGARELYLDVFLFFKPLPQSKKVSRVEEIPLSNEQTQTDGSKGQ